MYEVLSSYLENGLKIIFHPLRNTKTVSAGIWVKQGSKYESDQTNGISHLIEHLLVNASNTNNTKYKNIMNEIEFSGVQYNATITKEYTYYYFTGLKSKLDIMIEALACIVIGNKDINKKKLNDEKAVVRQEILTYYSSLNQIVERTNQAMWGNMDVGRIIVGNQDNIDKINGKSQKNIQTIFDAFGVEKVFGRKDVSDVCNLSYSAAGKIIVKLKEYELIEEVKGRGKGKYKFRNKI